MYSFSVLPTKFTSPFIPKIMVLRKERNKNGKVKSETNRSSEK